MSNTKETNLAVTGMTCGSCVRHVEAALRELEGVEKVSVELADGIVHVAHDPSRATTPMLVRAVVDAGYEARANDA